MDADMETEQGPATRLADIYERSAPAGFRLAYLLTDERALAEDLVQEAFFRFVGRLHHLRDPEAFDAYLRRTIVNLSKDVFRRRAVERSYVERRTAELRDGYSDRDVAAYGSMRTASLSLPPRQRAAIVLRYYEDLHESEIADLLHCRPSTVRSLVARGLEALLTDLPRGSRPNASTASARGIHAAASRLEVGRRTPSQPSTRPGDVGPQRGRRSALSESGSLVTESVERTGDESRNPLTMQ
jgi:RNA polymerase sigma factor (sigma-70 family)